MEFPPSLYSAQNAFSVIIAILLLRIIFKSLRRRNLSYLQGPPNHSFLAGHQYELRRQEDSGGLESQWFAKYGHAILTKACFGENVLMVADPRALQYIFQQSAYKFPKTTDETEAQLELAGPSIAAMHGTVHQRQRKVMLPAFSVQQLRTFLGVFHRHSGHLVDKWKDILNSGTQVVNVAPWLGKMTLDVIGQSGFNYEFDALRDGNTELAQEASTVFLDASIDVGRLELIEQHLWRWLPTWAMRSWGALVHSRRARRFKRFKDVANQIGRKMLAEQMAADVSDTTNKDVISVLIRANMTEDPSQRLSDEEVLAQIGTLIIAGHDTTAATLNFILWELAKHPEDQARIRAEITAVRSQKTGDTAFESVDYDRMEYLNAVIKEGLRLHAIASHLYRQAGADDVIPLAESITTREGRIINEIPVSKGQSIHCSLVGYNRLPSVWGPDAHMWRPDRFLNDDKRQISVGMVANVMTFSAGLKGCIGWRFSMMEMQAVLADLVDTFEFSLPPEKPEIQRMPLGVMTPMLKNDHSKGAQMPLKLTLIGDK